MRLKRESPTPLYLQLKNTLMAEINAGRYHPHQRLLSERELCEHYKVSRMTVRQALSELMRDGLVYARVGKGTFVSGPKIDQELRTLTGFTQDVFARGGKPSSQVLEFQVAPAGLHLSSVLHVMPEAEVVTLKRLRMADDTPLSIETAYLPYPYFPGILEHDFAIESLYSVFETEYHLRLVRAEQSMEAGLANHNELDLLQMTAPAAVLRMERLTYTDQNDLVEYVTSVYRGDRYKFRTSLQPRP
jgi:GntR family transcriptional regulator